MISPLPTLLWLGLVFSIIYLLNLFYQPFFLFMVGTSMSMSFRRYKSGLLQKVLTRTAKLFLIGLATQGIIYGNGFPNVGFSGFNFYNIRIPGILQRIAWAYLCVALMAMYFPKLKTDRFDLNYSVH
jgi:predicted acyltransferase